VSEHIKLTDLKHALARVLPPGYTWELGHGGKHACITLRNPKGDMRKVFISSSPSCIHAIRNITKDVQRKIMELSK
jgi:hypothetical protein